MGIKNFNTLKDKNIPLEQLNCAPRGEVLKKEIALCKCFCREAEPLVFEKDFCGGTCVGKRIMMVELYTEVVAKAVELS